MPALTTNRTFLGWIAGRDRFGDLTGIAHAVVALDDGTHAKACGTRPPGYSPIKPNAHDVGGRICQRCRAAVLGTKVERPERPSLRRRRRS